MASFDYPPLTPDPDPAPLSPTVPLNPPMVGEASPFEHVDGQNRDLILESIRAWVWRSLLPWTKAWQEYLVYWLALVASWLNEFVAAADAYITAHAISGYSWRTTVTPISPTGTTDVVIIVPDQEHRPLAVGDLVSDQSEDERYGIIVALIDSTHATVSPLGVLRGVAGHGWWTTVTPISDTGTTNVVLVADATRLPQVDDFVSDQSSDIRYGQITAVADSTHVTVTPLGVLRGPEGPTGPMGPPGSGIVETVVAGSNVTVDNTDPANPIVNATNGGGVVETVVAGANVTVDDTDPANPIVSASGGTGIVESVVAGTNVTVDDTDPANPVVNASGGTGIVESVVAGTNVTVDDTDPANPIVNASGGAPSPDPTSNMTYQVNSTTYEVKSTSGLTGYTVSNGTFRNGSGLPFAALISTAPATDDNAQVFAGIGGQVGMETLTNPGGVTDFGIFVGGGLGVYLNRAPLNLEDVGNISPSIPLVAGALSYQDVGGTLSLILYDGTNWIVIGP